MKRLTLILALVLMVLPMMAERVTPEMARKVATTFLNNNGVKAAQLTDLSKKAGFANLYIFTAEQGFVVMAADDCVQPILGYSLTGKFVAEGMPENISSWLQGYSDEIQWAIDNQVRTTDKIAKLWKELVERNSKTSIVRTGVDALLHTEWNQNGRYFENQFVALFNNLCPTVSSGGSGGRAYTGCVATAMAQVMKYWNYPTTGIGSHSYTWNNQTLSADFETTTYDWTKMTNTYNHLSSDIEKTAVATLMYHCGVSVEMDYGGNGSAASTYDVIYALQTYFNYAPTMQYKQKDSYTNSQWIAMLKNELDEGRPMQYRGTDNGGVGGHSFVCDGYDSDNNFHFNWGWASFCDGFYPLSSLETYDIGTGGGNGIYTYNQYAIIGIEPTSSLTAPTLLATATNAAITLSWSTVEGADTYNLYRDNVKIATNITGYSYTDIDIAPGINYEYYVRAVSGEIKSNPSNHVTKLVFYRDYTPEHLTASLTTNNATLIWNEPRNTTTLQYATDFSVRVGMGPGKDIYWAEAFDPSRLTGFEGMYINKVSTYLYFTGNYKLFIYEGDPSEESSNKLIEKEFSNTTAQAWKDIEIENPISFDNTKELWIILFFPGSDSNSGNYPAPCGTYDEIPFNDNTNPERFNPRLVGESMTKWNCISGNYSWLIRTYLTDGTYTYNLYDNGVKVNSDAINGNSYVHENPLDNSVHQYIVKTKYYGGESAASNMAGLALGTASLETLILGDNDNMTIAKNSKLTVSEAVSNGKPENLILEDGAQLIHNTSGVKATVKKTIAPYTANDNGWNFIASPVTENFAPSIDNGFLNGEIGENNNTYDLYYYDEPEHYWRNYEAHSQYFTIENKKGYLYSNEAATTLQFVGTLNQSNSSITINELSHSATELNGFNLVGNPFACNATIGQDCYVIEGRQVVLASGMKVFAPCEGAVVKATSDNNYSVTFTKHTGAKFDGKTNSLDLTVTQGKTTLDRARVRFSEGTSMEKFTFDDDNGTRLTFWQDGQDYAVAYANGLTELPLNFKAAKNGTYTLGIESNNLDLDYLHLIDNMTGANIDLLETTSYTFEAKTSDYPSRFKLVFSNREDAVGNNGNFAYVSNGEIIVTDANDDAILQVVDMLGHVILTHKVAPNSSLTTPNSPGVYMLRLITAEGVKTQKMIIE